MKILPQTNYYGLVIKCYNKAHSVTSLHQSALPASPPGAPSVMLGLGTLVQRTVNYENSTEKKTVCTILNSRFKFKRTIFKRKSN